ncbi:MAG: hypothetical protein HDQ99_19000 [Lachnospiraceae bacterium]|nr:hypothetical protein [Lachnospiraceae bacterium]
MRIVYDDAMQGSMTAAVEGFMDSLDVKEIVRYEWGTDRVQMGILKENLRLYLEPHRMSIGNTVTHAYGIGNNCQYPVYYHPEGSDEIQQCGNINLNSGMYGEGFVSCEDYNGKRVGAAYEVTTRGVAKK